MRWLITFALNIPPGGFDRWKEYWSKTMKFQDVGTAAPWQLEETIYLHQETFTLTEFSLQLVATLDYHRLLLQDTFDGEYEVWQADMTGSLLVGGIRYTFLNDLILDTTTLN
jgi:hypothetical protein